MEIIDANVEFVDEETEYYLELSKFKACFEASTKSQLTSVFYDECNCQVFSLLFGKTTDVTVKSRVEALHRSFKMDPLDPHDIISIKFSLDFKILSLQRTKSSVEFFTIENSNYAKHEFTQVFKKNSLIGFFWIDVNELVFVDEQTVKLGRIDLISKTISILRSLSLQTTINWFNYLNESSIILLNTGSTNGNSMQLLQISHTQIIRMAKFDLDGDFTRFVNSSDIIFGTIYGIPRVLWINYVNGLVGLQPEIVIYSILKKGVSKTDVLRVNQTGKCFAVNIIDNLIIVHNQNLKTSSVFDIGDDPFQGSVTYLNSVVESKSIKPIDYPINKVSNYEVYSPNWAVFQPNVIVDPKVGCLMYIELNLCGFLNAIIDDNKKLISFLLLRADSENFLGVALQRIINAKIKDLMEISIVFDIINRPLRAQLVQNLQQQISLTQSVKPITESEECSCTYRVVLNQSFMYTCIFLKQSEQIENCSNKRDIKMFNWILMEYIRSLIDFEIPVQHFLNELLINMLIINNEYYQLHQLIQYYVIADSKPLACRLLSIEKVYSGSQQLALDMLERLGTAKEEITEILLSNKQILAALKYAEQNCNFTDKKAFAMKFLDAARSIGNEDMFNSIKLHFSRQPKIVTAFLLP